MIFLGRRAVGIQVIAPGRKPRPDGYIAVLVSFDVEHPGDSDPDHDLCPKLSSKSSEKDALSRFL